MREAFEEINSIIRELKERSGDAAVDTLHFKTRELILKFDDMSPSVYTRAREEIGSLGDRVGVAFACLIQNQRFSDTRDLSMALSQIFLEKEDFYNSVNLALFTGRLFFLKKRLDLALEIFNSITPIADLAGRMSENSNEPKLLVIWAHMNYDLSVWVDSCQLCIDEKVIERGPEQLKQLLETGECGVRVAAARAAGAFKMNEALSALKESLRDRESPVRREALRALAEIGDKSATPDIIPCLSDRDDIVRFEAVETLRKIGDASIIATLKDLRDKEMDLERQQIIDETIKELSEKKDL